MRFTKILAFVAILSAGFCLNALQANAKCSEYSPLISPVGSTRDLVEGVIDKVEITMASSPVGTPEPVTSSVSQVKLYFASAKTGDIDHACFSIERIDVSPSMGQEGADKIFRRFMEKANLAMILNYHFAAKLVLAGGAGIPNQLHWKGPISLAKPE